MSKSGQWSLARNPILALLGIVLLAAACGDSAENDEERDAASIPAIVVYTSHPEQLIKPVFDAYTAESGTPIDYVIDGDQALIKKLKAEGDTTRADMLLLVDAGNLWHAADQGELRPTYSESLESNIPSHLRDPENQWFAMSVRARTIVYDTRKLESSELTGYAGLADKKWSGKLCLQSSDKVYNQSFVAMMIAQMGERDAEVMVRGWVDNLATSVFPDDTKLIQAIEDGQCQLGIVNAYNIGRQLREDADTPVAIFWPPEKTGGVHVNVAGAGVTRHARNPDGAKALLEWMSGESGQRLLDVDNLQYPANPAVQPSPLVAAWGEFDASPANVASAGEYQADAIKLMERANYR